MPTYLVSEISPLARSGDGRGEFWVEAGRNTYVQADKADDVRGAVAQDRYEYAVEADTAAGAVEIVARLVGKPGQWVAREVEAITVGLSVEHGGG